LKTLNENKAAIGSTQSKSLIRNKNTLERGQNLIKEVRGMNTESEESSNR